MIMLKRILLAVPGFQRLCRRLTRGHVRVFMYHRFREDGRQGDGLPASVFRDQLRRILDHHPVWTPAQQIAARLQDEGVRSGPVVITTDDGYRDYYDVAFPILREAGVPAVLFVTTGFVDGTVWMWWDKLRYLGERAPARTCELDLEGETIPLDFTTPAAGRATLRYLINRGRFIADRRKQEMLERLSERLRVAIPDEPPPGMAALTWDQVREMSAAGQVFAPHSLTHPILTRIAPQEADAEIRGSRDRLAGILGEAGRVFAYPQGGPSDADEEVARLVAAAGFAACYIAYQGPRLDDDPLQWPRYCAGDCPVAFQWALCGAEHLGNRLRRRLGLPIGPGRQYWYGSTPAA